ncbi:MAG: hypothetical protein V3S31_02875 [Dehalococcoidia bacterium]
MPRALLPIVIAVTLVAACTGDDSRVAVTPTPSATSVSPSVGPIETTSEVDFPPASTSGTPSAPFVAVPFVDGVPVDVTGPLAIYGGRVDEERTSSRTWPVVEVGTFDLTSERLLASFRVGSAGVYVSQTLLMGSEVLFNLEHTLIAYHLDGSISRLLRGGVDAELRFRSALLSPDGTTLVYAESGRPECGGACVVFLEVESGDEIERVTGTDPVLAALGGQFAQPVTWRDDGAGVVVRGQPNGHAFFGTATVMLDGSVRDHPELRGGQVASGGRYFFTFGEPVTTWEADELGCELYGGFTLMSVESGEIAAVATTPGLAIRQLEWSPDGAELLYGARPLPDPSAGACGAQYRAWDEIPYRWFLLDVEATASTEIADREAVRDRWAGGVSIRFVCDGELDEFIDTNSNRYFRCFETGGSRIDAALTVDGVVVAEGRFDRLFGFVEFGGD